MDRLRPFWLAAHAGGYSTKSTANITLNVRVDNSISGDYIDGSDGGRINVSFLKKKNLTHTHEIKACTRALTHPQGCQVYIHQTFSRWVVRHFFARKALKINTRGGAFRVLLQPWPTCISSSSICCICCFTSQSRWVVRCRSLPPRRVLTLFVNPGQTLLSCYIPTDWRPGLSLSLSRSLSARLRPHAILAPRPLPSPCRRA